MPQKMKSGWDPGYIKRSAQRYAIDVILAFSRNSFALKYARIHDWGTIEKIERSKMR